MPEEHKPEGAVDRPAEAAGKPAAAGRRAVADIQAEAEPDIWEAPGKPVVVDMPGEEARQAEADKRVAADKPAEEAGTAGVEEPLPRLREYRRIRRNGCSPQYCGRNWCKNAEPFFHLTGWFFSSTVIMAQEKGGFNRFSDSYWHT
jgi:hypothetical protein